MRWSIAIVLFMAAVTFAAERSTDAPARPPVRELSPGVFEVGNVRLSKEAQTVTFPALINMSSNLIEYACDGGDTRLHESLLRTDALPFNIHLASLLTCKDLPQPRALLDEAPVDGLPIAIEVQWDEQGATRTVPLEQLVLKMGRIVTSL